ncbi:hypothetical protein ACLMJK_007998 [Lecanora helva]
MPQRITGRAFRCREIAAYWDSLTDEEYGQLKEEYYRKSASKDYWSFEDTVLAMSGTDRTHLIFEYFEMQFGERVDMITVHDVVCSLLFLDNTVEGGREPSPRDLEVGKHYGPRRYRTARRKYAVMEDGSLGLANGRRSGYPSSRLGNGSHRDPHSRGFGGGSQSTPHRSGQAGHSETHSLTDLGTLNASCRMKVLCLLDHLATIKTVHMALESPMEGIGAMDMGVNQEGIGAMDTGVNQQGILIHQAVITDDIRVEEPEIISIEPRPRSQGRSSSELQTKPDCSQV